MTASTVQPAAGSSGDAVIVVRGLRKSYAQREAVAGIDLTVREGQIVALLGPNGAGKTTTVEILEGYRGRTSGEVSVLGHDPGHAERAYKERIGIVLQSTGVERFLSVVEVLRLYRGYYPRPRPLDELLELVDLTAQADTRVRRLSGGQRRRLDLAVALAGDPDLIFLDEPTTGFDPGARRAAWGMVRNLASLGKTVLLTTHFMDEAQVLADRIAVMVKGAIVAEGTPDEVIGRGSSATIVRVRLPVGAPPPPDDLLVSAIAPAAVSAIAPAAVAPVDATGYEFHTDAATAFVHRLTSWAVEAGFVFDDLTVTRPSLEDTYLALTGGAEDEDAAEAAATAAGGERRSRRGR